MLEAKRKELGIRLTGKSAVMPKPRRPAINIKPPSNRPGGASIRDEISLALLQAMQRAGAAYQGGDWAEAERLCQSVLKAKADDFDALNLSGIIAAQTRRAREAMDLLGRAVAANPGISSAHSNLGNVLKDLKRLDEALASYDRALTIKPDYAEALNNRGVTLKDLKRFDEALESYDRALKIKPDYAEALNNRGVTLKDLERLAEALESYGRALELKPDYAEALCPSGKRA